MIEHSLQNDGVKMITYPKELQESVQNAARSWDKFCELDDQVKRLFTTDDNQFGVGYESKDGTQMNGDRKENFDYSPQGVDHLESVLKSTNNATATHFIEAVKALYNYLEPMVDEFSSDIRTVGYSELARASYPSAYFRFIHYPAGTEVGSLIAEPHTDHSGFTFHLYETTDGCERLTEDGTWIKLPVLENQTAAFGGMQTQLVTKGEVKALAHRVVANDESCRNGRNVIVCFIALKDIPRYNKRDHGRLQEQKPGFNYTLHSESFENLFE